MILASLDPGSARCALVIAAHAPGEPLALLHHEVFPVGHKEDLPEPKITIGKDGKERAQTYRRVLTPDEESALVTAIVERLYRHAVDTLLVEVTAPYIADGGNVMAARAQVKEVGISNGIVKRIEDRVMIFGRIRIVTTPDKHGDHHLGIPRVTWLAALRRHASAGLTPGVPPIPKAIGKRGTALDPLLRAHLPALFSAPLPEPVASAQAESEGGEDATRERAPGPDLRDAAGLLLSAVLEIPASATRAPRAPRVASPDGTTPARAPRQPRAEKSPRRGERLAREAWVREKIAIRAAWRTLHGCTCPAKQGRPSKDCPAFEAHKAAGAKRREKAAEEARERESPAKDGEA